MSRIISPVPIVIQIEYNEVTGACAFSTSRDVQFPVVVSIFSQLMIQMVKDYAKSPAVAAAAPIPGGADGSQKSS